MIFINPLHGSIDGFTFFQSYTHELTKALDDKARKEYLVSAGLISNFLKICLFIYSWKDIIHLSDSGFRCSKFSLSVMTYCSH